jgi:hypothetical protein
MVFSQVKQQLDQQNYGYQTSKADTSTGQHDELDVVVHPGFSMINYDEDESIFDWLDQTRFGVNSDFSSQDSYELYLSDLGENLQQTENPVIFLYDEGQLDQYQKFLEERIGIDIDGNNNHFIETDPKSGYIDTIELWATIGLIDQLDENVEITIHGEQNGKCTEDSMESLQEVEEVLNRNDSFKYGEVFPEVRL